MKKRVFRNYSYTQADEFADFLHEMSLKGWHFTRWGLGLEFEQGEPKDITYAVEVFINGSEMDTRPEPETEEFAAYCEVAGWRFLDAKRKFCILAKIKEDAEPIVTEEERFQNICKAEKKYQWPQFLVSGFAAYIFLSNFINYDFKNQIEHNIMLLMTTILILQFFIWTVRLSMFGVWYLKIKKRRESGEIIYYGEKGKRRLPYQLLWNVLVPFIVVIPMVSYKMMKAAIVVLLVCSIMNLCLWGIHTYRPTRINHRVIEISMGMGLIFLAWLLANLLM